MSSNDPIITNGTQTVTTTTTTTTTATSQPDPLSPAPGPDDPNLADLRLLINGKSIYERHLPGQTYITARVQRLQHGYFSAGSIMQDGDLENVDFVALNFVFHAPRTNKFRFSAATIRASLMLETGHGCGEKRTGKPHPSHPSPPSEEEEDNDNSPPRFLMHAPHLIYGAVSPESLQWAFNLGGSLGMSQAPMSASISPGGGMKESYKRYEMMRIQGSVRTLPGNSSDRGQIVWSLEENCLQRSGLPRDFTFVMLVQKPADHHRRRVLLMLDIEAEVKGRLFSFPWKATTKPLCRRSVDFDREVGQRFEPATPNRGFNFAALKSCLEDYVCMPGRVYASKVRERKESNRGIQISY